MLAIESVPASERLLTYQECARHLLVRYLVAKSLVEGSIDNKECRPFSEELIAKNADGICFLFEVRGSIYHVMLPRKEECRQTIENDPVRENDPELFCMDLSKPAKIDDRTNEMQALLSGLN